MRQNIGIVMIALVIVGVKLIAPPAEKRIRTDPAYTPVAHSDGVFLAKDSCAIFEFTQELPGSVCDTATISKGRP